MARVGSVIIGEFSKLQFKGVPIEDAEQLAGVFVKKFIKDNKGVFDAKAEDFIELAAKVIGQKTYNKLDQIPKNLQQEFTNLMASDAVWFSVSPDDSAEKLFDAGTNTYQKFNPATQGWMGAFFESLFLNKAPDSKAAADINALEENMLNYFKNAALEVKTSYTGTPTIHPGVAYTHSISANNQQALETVLEDPVNELIARTIGILKILEKMAALLLVKTAYGKAAPNHKWVKFTFESVWIYSQLNIKLLMKAYENKSTKKIGEKTINIGNLYGVSLENITFPDWVESGQAGIRIKNNGTIGTTKFGVTMNVGKGQADTNEVISTIYLSQKDFLSTPQGMMAWSDAIHSISRATKEITITSKRGIKSSFWLWKRDI